MSWFNSLTSNVKNLLIPENPNKVLDVRVDEYSNKHIHLREDSLLVYSNHNNTKFELVLHRPCNETLYEAFSLCRCPDFESASSKFLSFKTSVPVIASISKVAINSAVLQKLCDLIVEHPSWNVAHLVTRLGYPECFADERVAKYINVEESEHGIVPLQLAIMDLNTKMVYVLLSHNASLDSFDHELNSVLHYAAGTNKQIISLLCEKSKNTLNSKNNMGFTPLHKACLADKPECVRALLQAGADVNISASQSRCHSSVAASQVEFSHQIFSEKLYQKDFKYGGTPLHWACSGEVIEDLISQNCDINVPNFEQRTALHVMVLRNRLECLVVLLSHDADCNMKDKDGNTPLHLAVKEKKEDMIKALIVFGADLSSTNNDGHLPRHNIPYRELAGNNVLWILSSVGAPRCPPYTGGCNSGCDSESQFDGEPLLTTPSTKPMNALNILLDQIGRKDTENEQDGKKPCRMLSLDGGGIRGLVLIVMLMEIEKKLGKPIIESFDWVAGTSTGGILALALACGKSPRECLSLYFKMKNTVFKGKKPYASEPFESILKDVFGENATMSDLKMPKIMITAVLADRLPVDLHLFRNYKSVYEMLEIEPTSEFPPPEPPEQQLIWHAARATGAAPTYFRAFGRYLDGGLIANNPTLDALTEVYGYEKYCQSQGEPFEPLDFVLSLGTGLGPVSTMNGEVDVFRPENLWECGKVMLRICAISQVLVDQATQTDGRVVERARAWCSSQGICYHRLSPQLSEDVDLDQKEDKILTNMLWETRVYMHSERDLLTQIAAELKR